MSNFQYCFINAFLHLKVHSYHSCLWMNSFKFVPLHAWFLVIAFICALLSVSACVCICVSIPNTSGMIWWLVEQAFPCSQLLCIWYLPLIKWYGLALLTQHIMNDCLQRLMWRGTIYTTWKADCFSYYGEWVNV